LVGIKQRFCQDELRQIYRSLQFMRGKTPRFGARLLKEIQFWILLSLKGG
jgi:hypothetical protein